MRKQRYTVHQPQRPKYVSDKDKTVLEDDSGRLSLTGPILDTAIMCTGRALGATRLRPLLPPSLPLHVTRRRACGSSS